MRGRGSEQLASKRHLERGAGSTSARGRGGREHESCGHAPHTPVACCAVREQRTCFPHARPGLLRHSRLRGRQKVGQHRRRRLHVGVASRGARRDAHGGTRRYSCDAVAQKRQGLLHLTLLPLQCGRGTTAQHRFAHRLAVVPPSKRLARVRHLCTRNRYCTCLTKGPRLIATRPDCNPNPCEATHAGDASHTRREALQDARGRVERGCVAAGRCVQDERAGSDSGGRPELLCDVSTAREGALWAVCARIEAREKKAHRNLFMML